MQQNQQSSHTEIDSTDGGEEIGGVGTIIQSIRFYFMIFTSFRWGALTREIRFYLMIPSIGDSATSSLTMIKGSLIQDIVKKDIGDIENLGTLFSVISVTLKRKHHNTTLH